MGTIATDKGTAKQCIAQITDKTIAERSRIPVAVMRLNPALRVVLATLSMMDVGTSTSSTLLQVLQIKNCGG